MYSNLIWMSHLAAESEQAVDDGGEVLVLLPQVDGLEDIHIGHTVLLQSLLEAVNELKTTSIPSAQSRKKKSKISEAVYSENVSYFCLTC